MRTATAILILVGAGATANAQNIDILTCWGPSGTHIQHELPISSFLYESDTYCNYPYRHKFTVHHNQTLKISESYDITPSSSPTHFSRNVDFTGWNLKKGDVITYYSHVKILTGPYAGQWDQDYLYGDVVDLIASAPTMERSLLPAAIDEKRRFETLLG